MTKPFDILFTDMDWGLKAEETVYQDADKYLHGIRLIGEKNH